MTTGYWLAVVLALVLVVLIVGLLRGRRIREKYAAIWLVLGIAVFVLALFPELTFWLADVTGVSQPVNLLFAVGSAVLLSVCIQLSSEISSLEEETRTLAEEVALLRLEVHERGPRPSSLPEPPPTPGLRPAHDPETTGGTP